MLSFELSMPTKIIFGKGSIAKLGEMLLKNGNRVLLVYGSGSIKKIGLYNQIIKTFNEYNIIYKELSGIKPNPILSTVKKGIELCREHNINLILGAGGGSVIDSIKAISAGVNYKGDVWDFFIGKGNLVNPLPVASILTLSATGSEANGGCVISNEDTKEKLPFVHPLLKPCFSILDPDYTSHLPANQTAAGIADIMSHCIEQYFSNVEETYIQDRLTEAILKTCIHYGPILINNPTDYHARANIMWASTLALIGILGAGKEGDWSTHYIEHKVSAVSDLTHGTGLAILTPHWMNEVLSETTLDKFINFAVNVFNVSPGEDKMFVAKQGIQKLTDFFKSLHIPSTLSETGFYADNNLLNKMANDIQKYGPIGKFKKLDNEAIVRILKSAC